MSNHAPIDTLPRTRQVFCVRFQKPGGTTQTAWYAYESAAERKACSRPTTQRQRQLTPVPS